MLLRDVGQDRNDQWVRRFDLPQSLGQSDDAFHVVAVAGQKGYVCPAWQGGGYGETRLSDAGGDEFRSHCVVVTCPREKGTRLIGEEGLDPCKARERARELAGDGEKEAEIDGFDTALEG